MSPCRGLLVYDNNKRNNYKQTHFFTFVYSLKMVKLTSKLKTTWMMNCFGSLMTLLRYVECMYIHMYACMHTYMIYAHPPYIVSIVIFRQITVYIYKYIYIYISNLIHIFIVKDSHL